MWRVGCNNSLEDDERRDKISGYYDFSEGGGGITKDIFLFMTQVLGP